MISGSMSGGFAPEERATDPLPAGFASSLTDAERAALALDVCWLQWRAEFRKQVLASGILRRGWRSVFEADMILSLIAFSWMNGRAITLKQLSTYFEPFATTTTVFRHLDDMEEAGIIHRVPDTQDKRRLLLIPTERLEHVGKAFLSA
jgi:MarR family